MTETLEAVVPLGHGADFSLDRRYRYRFYWYWDAQRPPLGFVMLNPSQGGKVVGGPIPTDPTLRVCKGRAQLLRKYGGIEIANLYAWVATNPEDLRLSADPVGPDNDEHLRRLAFNCPDVILAWGAAAEPARAAEVVQILQSGQVKPKLWYLSMTASGQPRHPLHIGYDVALKPWPEAAP
jgi:hypothetical protein